MIFDNPNKGAVDFLEAIGWMETEIDGEVYFVHMGTHQQIKDALSGRCAELYSEASSIFIHFWSVEGTS